MARPGAMKLKGSFKKGGTVKATGAYKLHKGEKVVPAKKTKGKPKQGSKHPLKRSRNKAVKKGQLIPSPKNLPKKTLKIRTSGTFKGKSNRLGGGGRFAQLAAKAGGGKKGAAIAAAAGMKKYGKKRMVAMAKAGKKRA